MGIAGKSIKDKLESIGIKVDCFCDNDSAKVGNTYKGCACISKDELKKINDDTVIIVESLYYKQIKKQLIDEGFENIERIFFEKIAGEKYIEENKDTFSDDVERVREILSDEKSKRVFDHIIKAYTSESLCDDYFDEIYEDNQYFADGLIRLSENECFVDLGAYIGDSGEAFIDKVKGKFDRLFLFELDPNIYKRLMINVSKLYDKTEKGIIQCLPYGASDETAEVVLSEGDSSSKMVMGSVDKKADDIVGIVKKIDDVLADERVTFIKADIEGAELQALRGAQSIIKPKTPFWYSAFIIVFPTH